MTEYITDKLGWIDDFRALPGECGSPLSRKIYLQALLGQGTQPHKLKEMGFSFEMIQEVFMNQLRNTYFKVGDLVEIKMKHGVVKMGIITGEHFSGAIGREYVILPQDGGNRVIASPCDLTVVSEK